MGRSKWKGPFIEKALLNRGLKQKTWSRKSTILPCLIGKQLNIHSVILKN
jgi:ribosomal protein S19